jgi:hypothetical protein
MMKKTHELRAVILWILIYLILMDVAVNIVFKYPEDPRNISPPKLSQFFEYGRSVEGKLSRMTGKTDEESAPIVGSGWIREPKIRYFSSVQDSTSHPTITVYGMSHSVMLAEDLAKVDNSFVVRSCGAPGAVPSWAYAAYISDKERLHSEAVVLAVMTRGVPLTSTTSGTTNHFDSVWPYTYPRYYSMAGNLTAVYPPFLSLAGYREYFYDPEKWNEYVDWLNQNDKYYDPLLFRKTFLDNSSIMRMVRRAYAYSSRRRKDARVYNDKDGFNAHSEEVEILKSIIVSFAEDAKRNSSLPIIYIVNNVFMGDHLYRVLEPTLASHKILYVSSHEICPPDDPTLFEANSHFIPSKNILLAEAVMELIKSNLKMN